MFRIIIFETDFNKMNLDFAKLEFIGNYIYYLIRYYASFQ